jgi:DNA-binding PadR family transcriptional regulator
MVVVPEFGDDEEMMYVIKQALDELLQKGYLEVVGIDKNGEWLYKATEKGLKYFENRRPGK